MKYILIKKNGVDLMIIIPDELKIRDIMQEIKDEEIVRSGSFCFFKRTARNEKGEPIVQASALSVKVISDYTKEEKKTDEANLMDILTEDF